MVELFVGLKTEAMETLPSDYSDITIEARASSSEATETSSVALEAEKILENANEIITEVIPAPQLRAGSNTITFNGSDIRVLFPENMKDYLVERDGYLINTYGSSITGLVLDSDDSANITQYHSRYFTLYPFTNTSGNSAAYQYGAFSYLTTYRPSNYGSLTGTNEYGNAVLKESPGLFRGFTDFQLIMIFAAGLLVLIQFFGGIFRR